MPDLSIALKEWDLLIRDLLAGRQALLLRKGGILDSDNHFELDHPRFLFFPTFIHQNPLMVKPDRRPDIRTLPAEPEQIEITGWGEAADILEVPSRPAIDRLRDLHLWDEPLIDMRFHYRPEKPLFLVLIRAFTLPAPLRITNTLDYAGCKSWVPLAAPISTDHSTQSLPESHLTALATRIRTVFAS